MEMNYKSIIKWTFILIFDFSIFMILSVLLMDYDDFYDESKGEYWSLGSMTNYQKVIYILHNLWLLLNFLFFILVLWTGWKKFKNA